MCPNTFNFLTFISLLKGCFQSFVLIKGKGKKLEKPETQKSAKKCQEKCYGTPNCKEFLFDERNGICELYENLNQKKREMGSRFLIYGPRTCQPDQQAGCNAYE